MTPRRGVFWWTAATLLVCLAWPNPAAAVSGTVTVDDTQPGITSDNGDPYVDGEDRVRATLGDNFFLDTKKGGGTSIRELIFDLSDCLEDECSSPFPGVLTVEASINTPGNNDLQGLGLNDPTDVKLQVIFPDPWGDGLQWFLRFNPDGDFCNSHATIEVTTVDVTRADADTWTFVADSGDVACLLSNTTKGKPVLSHEGFYRVPFEFTFTASEDGNGGGCTLGQKGDDCSVDEDCCSNKCKGNNTCR